MALLLWLPLTGNLNNQGLLDVEPTTLGTLTYEDGKLGQCVRISDGSQVANGISLPNTNLVNELGRHFSCSVWIKPTGDHIHYEGAIISSGDWNKKRWAFGIKKDNSMVDVFGPNYNRNVTCNIPINEWTHLVSVFDDGIGKLYKNGIYVTQYDFGNAIMESDATNTTIGRETYGGGYFGFNGCIQDIRIYDHALSPKEIEVLSRGLILHYPLNREGFGQDNLLRNSHLIWYTGSDYTNKPNKSYDEETKTAIVEFYSSTSQMNAWCFVTPQLGGGSAVTSMTTGEFVYTYSFDVRFSQYTTTDVKNHIDFRTGSSVNRADVSFTDEEKDGNWHRVSLSISGNDIQRNACLIQIFIPSAHTDSFTVYAKNFKIEQGAVATPWAPHPSDGLYSSMGLDENIVYDVSGYKHNGTASGVIYSADTPKYELSTAFDGLTNGITITNLNISNVLNNQCTISFWIKPSNETGKRSVYFSAYSQTSWSIEKNTSNRIRSYWNGSPDKSFTTSSIIDGEWQHIVLVKDGTSSLKLYYNGEFKYEFTDTHNALNFGTTWRIGRDTRQNDGTPYEGLMSDFRLYATALSAETIAELYHTGASLADNGTLMTNQFVEV